MDQSQKTIELCLEEDRISFYVTTYAFIDMKINEFRIASFILCFVYILIGTLVVMVSFPEYKIWGFDHDHILWLPVVIITLPANILLFGLVMVDNSVISVIILQTVVLCAFWYFSNKMVIRKSGN